MKILNWGLIGAGDIARKRIAPALRDLPNCNLISVSRSRSELAEAFATEFGAKKWFADWRDLLADNEIEAVYLATPVYLHAEQTIAAAEAGKHVLCEKPMALTVPECDQMLAAGRANNVKLGLAYYRRFYPLIARIKEIIETGMIGRVSVVQINAFEYFEPDEHHPRRWLIEKEKSGGGPLMDFGCHRLEVLTHLFGEIKQVKSIISKQIFERQVEDTATVILEFENGISATLTITHSAFEPRDTLDIYGTKGSISVPVLNQGELNLRIGKNVIVESHPPQDNVHRPLINNFSEAVLNGFEPEITGETGRKIAELTQRIYAS